MEAEHFGINFKRAIRRRAIETALTGNSKTPLHDVHHFESSQRPEFWIDKLLHDITVVEKKRENVMSDLSDIVRSNFGVKYGNLGLVLLGSGSNGGAVIRELMQTQCYSATKYPDNHSDIDWALLHDVENPVSEEDAYNIDECVSDNAVQLFEKYCLTSEFKLCRRTVPWDVSYRIRNIRDNSDAYRLVSDKKNLSWTLLGYFLPSFPSYVNERNTTLLLNALHQLWINDQQTWITRTIDMANQWQRIHSLRMKYFFLPDEVRTDEVVNRIVDYLIDTTVTTHPFTKLINATGDIDYSVE